MRGSHEFIRGCLTPEIGVTLHDFVTTPPGGTPVIPDGMWLDGVPDNTYNVLIFSGGPVLYFVSVNDGGFNVFGTPVGLNYGVDYYNLQLTTMGGTGSCILDHIRADFPIDNTEGFATKGVGGPRRKVCNRIFWNFTGCNDNWIFENDSSNYVFYVDFDDIATYQQGFSQRLYGRLFRNPADPLNEYAFELYQDVARTILLYSTVPTGAPGEWRVQGTYYEKISLYDIAGGGPPYAVAGNCSVFVTAQLLADYDFETRKNVWAVDDQNIPPIDFVDITDDLKGQFRITSGENEGVINKDISRKINFTLNNTLNQYDYRVMNPSYDPLHVPEKWFNGPRDERIYEQTGGATGNGKEIGNIRAGRFIIVQTGVYDNFSSSYIWIDKFRGRVGDIAYSRADNTLQLTVDDERMWYRQKKISPDYYINITFEGIFQQQAEKRLKIHPSQIVTPVTGIKIPFVYMPDLGDTVWDALVKLSEIVFGKMELTEDGKLKCYSRLFEGDPVYAWDAQGGQDDARTLGENVVDDSRETLSSSVQYNQKIINTCVVKSRPTFIEEKIEKVWKFKAFYNEEIGKNTGYLKPGRYFGDVWAQNLVSNSGTGPVKSIDRDSNFNTGGQDIRNESFELVIDVVNVGTVDISITRLFDDSTFAGTVPADGIAEFDVGTIHPDAANVFCVMEADAVLLVSDSTELQLGVSYFADYGDKFRVLPNYTWFIALPGYNNLKFSIVSALYDPGGPNDWKDEKEAGSIVGNNFADRVIMAYDPDSPQTDPDLHNIFYYDSFGGDVLTRVPILLYNADVNSRYVMSVEIFGRRIVEQSNLVVNTKARALVLEAFGGEQSLEIDNSFVPTALHAQYMGKFVVDNYAVNRDIPQIVLKQPRPFYQIGDRVRVVDDYAALTFEYIIMTMDEIFTVDSASLTCRLRLADKTVGAYDITTSQAESIIENQTDYSKLAETADVNRGASATEVRRDTYFMHGLTWHLRAFDFTTGIYSAGGVPPAAPGVWPGEFYAGELREFEEPPVVMIFPAYAPRLFGGGPSVTEGIQSFPIVTTATSFIANCQTHGRAGYNDHWCYWIAIGRTKRYIG